MEKTSITSAVAPQQRLAGKVAIVTGGASGVGASTVQIFHEHGAKVVIADIQDKLGQAIAEKHNVCYIHCDVRNEDEVRNLVDTTVAKYGKLDIMYNNAGIIDRIYGGILDSKKSDLDRLLSVNLVGAFLGAKHAARVMVPQGKGCILFTSSACTEVGGIATHTYAMTKSGLLGLSKNLAAELGQYGIRVNTISPLGLATPFGGARPKVLVPIAEKMLSQLGPLKGQTLKPEGVAQAALYLASEEARYMTGFNLVVDGGYSVVNTKLVRYLALWYKMKSLIQLGVGSKLLFTCLVLSVLFYSIMQKDKY